MGISIWVIFFESNTCIRKRSEGLFQKSNNGVD